MITFRPAQIRAILTRDCPIIFANPVRANTNVASFVQSFPGTNQKYIFRPHHHRPSMLSPPTIKPYHLLFQLCSLFRPPMTAVPAVPFPLLSPSPFRRRSQLYLTRCLDPLWPPRSAVPHSSAVSAPFGHRDQLYHTLPLFRPHWPRIQLPYTPLLIPLAASSLPRCQL